jgi:hypothetical protein
VWPRRGGFDFVEETLDEVSVSIEEGTEGRHVLAVRHGLNIGPCAPFIEMLPLAGVDERRADMFEVSLCWAS